MTHRALVMVDDRTATLVEVGAKALHCGERTRDGLMVLRAAWKYEYAYPLGQEMPLALGRYKEHPVPRAKPVAAPQRPVQAPQRARQRPVIRMAPVDLEMPPTWRKDALEAAIANPYNC